MAKQWQAWNSNAQMDQQQTRNFLHQRNGEMDRTSEEMYGHKWWLGWKISVQCGRELNFLHSDITVIILHGQILIIQLETLLINHPSYIVILLGAYFFMQPPPFTVHGGPLSCMQVSVLRDVHAYHVYHLHHALWGHPSWPFHCVCLKAWSSWLILDLDSLNILLYILLSDIVCHLQDKYFGFLGAFEKLLKAAISFIMSVLPAIFPRMEQLDSYLINFNEISFWVLLFKCVEKIEVCLLSGR